MMNHFKYKYFKSYIIKSIDKEVDKLKKIEKSKNEQNDNKDDLKQLQILNELRDYAANAKCSGYRMNKKGLIMTFQCITLFR